MNLWECFITLHLKVMFSPTRADRSGCGGARGWKKSYHTDWRFHSFWRFCSFWYAAARPGVKPWGFPICAEHGLSVCSPSFSDIDIVDHFSLNQSRTEEITLKEDFRNEFLTLVDFGKKYIFVLDVGYSLPSSSYFLCEQEMNHRWAILGCWTWTCRACLTTEMLLETRAEDATCSVRAFP